MNIDFNSDLPPDCNTVKVSILDSDAEKM